MSTRRNAEANKERAESAGGGTTREQVFEFLKSDASKILAIFFVLSSTVATLAVAYDVWVNDEHSPVFETFFSWFLSTFIVSAVIWSIAIGRPITF